MKTLISILTFCFILAGFVCLADDWYIEQKYPYQHMGKRYKYDLLNPGDEIRYDLDIGLQLREEVDVGDEIRRDVDPWDGRFRGPMDTWNIDP